MMTCHFRVYETESGCRPNMLNCGQVAQYLWMQRVGFTIYEGKVVQRLIQLADEQ